VAAARVNLVMSKVTILGAGAWGTALAITLAKGRHAVTLAVRRPAQLAAIRAAGANAAYLPGVAIAPAIALTGDWAAAVHSAETIVMAVPSRFARAAIAPIVRAIPAAAALVSVTKGIEPDTLLTMTRMLAELAPPAARVAVLSGPGFAAEIARGKPAALVAAAHDEPVARRVQELFAGPSLRVYRSADVVGVELGGVIKNVIAIAAGIGEGLELGSSARAALITRGLAEMMRLAAAAGARGETMAGLAGLGDLVLTCTGELSRNRALGHKIGRGEAYVPAGDGEPVAEGAVNASAIRTLAARMGVEMPIVAAVCRILYEAAPATAMVDELLSRQLKAEF
jgi:glycerol-3-phosphate dehydrogenase (NAD(P)+)